MLTISRFVLSGLSLFTVLVQAGCALAWTHNPAGTGVRSYERNEIEHFIRKLGASDEVATLVRIQKDGGVRIILRSGRAFDVRCNGQIREFQLPSDEVFFDEQGEPFAWYKDTILRFRPGFAAPELWNVIRVDPEGRYFISRAATESDGLTRIYRTTAPSNPFGKTPIFGVNTSIFSSHNRVIVVGSVRGSDALRMMIYAANALGLEELETIEISQPKTWFPGTLFAVDATSDLSRLLFTYDRDPPMGSSLYVFDVSSRSMIRLGKLQNFHLFSPCDPIRTSK
jgi:hypothetical protein